MPIVIALLAAIGLSALLFATVGRLGRGGDVADVRAEPDQATAEAVAQHSWLRRFLLSRRDATKATGLLLTIAVLGIAVFIVAVGSLLEMVNTHQGFARWDDAAARFGARHATPDTTSLLKAVTTLGASWFTYVVVGVVGIVIAIRSRRISVLAFLATTVVAVVLVNNLVKLLVDRKRPDIARLIGAHGSSFPSGHSAMAAGCYAALALVLGVGRSRRTRIILAGVAIVIAVAVASSRVLLGVHWLTDVLAGLAVGWACFALCSIAFGGRVLRFGEPVEQAQDTAQDVAAATQAPMPAKTPQARATDRALSHVDRG